jgi:hypothetical protein
MAAVRRLPAWLAVGTVTCLLLAAAAALLVPRLIDFAAIKQQIQAVVMKHTGGQLDYQELRLTFFPKLSIELRELTLSIPERAEAEVAALRLCPAFFALLRGELDLAQLEADRPRVHLALPEPNVAGTPAQPLVLSELGPALAMTVGPFAEVAAGLQLQVGNGHLTIVRGKQRPVEIAGLNLRAGMAAKDRNAVETKLQVDLAELRLSRDGRAETLKGLRLSGGVLRTEDALTVKIDRLNLAEPALNLAGELVLAPTAPAITLNLSGTDIDVDATRNTALALAGDITPVKEIFDYLRGGRVARISFTSHGGKPSELGDLNNILITGLLRDGRISIPAIQLDLTEVAGQVGISQGVLQGTALAARLGKSTGQDGLLRISLTRASELFQLELLLNADLAETRALLLRLVKKPAFVAELEKITSLHGTGRGKLRLGDHLKSIAAEVEVSQLSLTADHQRWPWPITVTEGQVAFAKNRLSLDQFSGSLGRSRFADLSAQFLWEKDLVLDIGSGRFDLEMAELSPWLTVQEGLRERLQSIKQVSGRLALSALTFQGVLANPAGWRFTSTGTVDGFAVETATFPGTVTFASGGFKLDSEQLSFDKLRATGLDAVLLLSGRLKGARQRLDRLDFTLDGSLGRQSVAWLSETLKVPPSYAIQGPLTISSGQLSWQPDASTFFKGLLTLAQGPAITAEVDSRPGQLQVRQLHIKDQFSDAAMVCDLRKEQHDFRFTGALDNETLRGLFVDRRFASGKVAGDFRVTVPQAGEGAVTSSGQLTGENLPILLPSGDTVNFDRITLNADGAQVQFAITRLNWHNLVWEPVEGAISFDHNRTDIRFANAKLCGISSLGLLSLAGDGFSLDMSLEGKNLDVATSYTCLTEGRVKATGHLDFNSQVTARGQRGELVRSLQGPLQLTLHKGVIEQDKLVSRTLEVLNVTEIVKGRLPDLSATGFTYDSITLQGKFLKGKLLIDKFFMDGETLDLVGNGEIHLADEKVNAQLLAAPFKTVDTVVKFIPGVNYLLAGSLVTIPVSISGTLDDPEVTILSPAAVGASLYNLAERTITSPFKLLDKINSWSKGKSK